MLKIFIAIFILLFTATAGHTQQIRNGGLSGTVMSFSENTSGGTAANLFTTPATGNSRFILTQFCGNHGSQRTLSLGGSILGVIVQIRGGVGPTTDDRCVSFDPGIALSQNETISCRRIGGNDETGHCMITGVLSRR